MDIKEVERKRILAIEQAQSELQQLIMDATMRGIKSSAVRLDLAKIIGKVERALKELETDEKFIEHIKESLMQSYQRWNVQVVSALIKTQKQVNLDVLNKTIANLKGNNPTIAKAKQSGGFVIADNIASKGGIENIRDFITHVEDGGAARYVDYVGMVKKAMTDISKQLANGTLTLKDKRGHNKSVRGMAEIQARYDIITDDLERLKKRGIKLVIASTHPNASERCSWWQGKIFKVDLDISSRPMAEYKGKPKQTIVGHIDGKPIYSLKEACDNGFLSFNCQHRLIAYYKGVNPKQYNLVEVKKKRELSQKQRYLERRIRQAKAEELLAVDKADRKEAKNKSKELQEQYKTFCEDNKLIRFDWRTRITETERGLTGLSNPIDIDVDKAVEKSQKKVKVDIDTAWLTKIPKEEVNTNVNRVKDLISEYPSMVKFVNENGLKFTKTDTEGGKTIAYCRYSLSEENKQIELAINPYFYKSKESIIETNKKNVSVGWSMPCNEDKYEIYSITHEVGHAIHTYLIKQIPDKDPALWKKLLGRSQKPWYAREKAFDRTVKMFTDEIFEIAKTDNEWDEADVVKNLSRYGCSNRYEAFAEMFANAKCGNPNGLGKAMNKWLKGKME